MSIGMYTPEAPLVSIFFNLHSISFSCLGHQKWTDQIVQTKLDKIDILEYCSCNASLFFEKI